MLYLGYILCRIAAALLPISLAHLVADRVADLWYLASPGLRRTLRFNLSRVPGVAADPTRARRLPLQMTRNFARVIAEFMYLPKINPGNLGRYVDLDSFRSVASMVAGRPAIFATAHLGNWELGAVATCMLGVELHVVVYDHPNARIARVFRRRREAKGLRLMSVRSAARSLPAVLERGSLGIAADRDFSGQGAPARIFGVSRRVPFAYAGLADSRGIPILPVFCVRKQDGKYHLLSDGPIRLAPKHGGEPLKLVEAFLRVAEKYIEKYPDQWYLFEKLGEEPPAAEAHT